MQEIQFRCLGREDTLEKSMATHSSILAWGTLWTEEPGRLQSMGSQRVRQDCAKDLGLVYWVGKIPWRREKLPTPVFWPGEFHGLYNPWGHNESDTTEWLWRKKRMTNSFINSLISFQVSFHCSLCKMCYSWSFLDFNLEERCCTCVSGT